MSSNVVKMQQPVQITLTDVFMSPDRITNLKGQPLSCVYIAVLDYVERNPGKSVRDIAQTLRITRPRVSRAIDRLYGEGLLTSKTNRSDMRLVVVNVLPRGVQLLNSIRTTIHLFASQR